MDVRRRSGGRREGKEMLVHFQKSKIGIKVGKITLSRVRFEIFTAVTMKNGVFLDVTP
jgi:hypothetical protein